jgi:hypothetical protein
MKSNANLIPRQEGKLRKLQSSLTLRVKIAGTLSFRVPAIAVMVGFWLMLSV